MDFFGSQDIEKMVANQDLDGLHHLLETQDKAIRLQAALALAEMDDNEGWRYLMEAARQTDDSEFQVEVVSLLRDLNPQRVIPVLAEALIHASGETADVIKEALEAIGGREAGDALRQAGYEQVLPHMSGNLQLMEYEGDYVRSILPENVQVEFLTAEQHLKHAAELREAEMPEQSLIEDSLALWLSPEWADAWYLRGALFEDLERDFEARLCYQWALKLDPNQVEAGEALASFDAEDVFPTLDLDALMTGMNSPDWRERRDAAAGLGEMGENAPEEAVDELIKRLRDAEREVRHAAIEAAGNIGDRRAIQPLLTREEESTWLLRFAVIEALAQLGTVEGLTAVLRREMDQVQERNPVFSSQKDPLLEVEYDRLMEIGVLAYEKTSDLESLLTLVESNAWEEVGEDLMDSESTADEEALEDTEDLEFYVDEVAQMVSLALERLAMPHLAAFEPTILQRLADVPDLLLLEADDEAQPVMIHDLSDLREAAKAELAKR